MQLLKTNRMVLTWLCAYPTDKNTSVWMKRLYALLGSTVISGNLIGLSVSYAFFHNNRSTNFEGSLNALSQVFGNGNMFYVGVTGVLYRHKFRAIFDDLSKLYDNAITANDNSIRFFEQANNKCQRLWRIYLKVMLGGYVVTTPVFCCLTLILCLKMNGHFVSQYMYRPFNIACPWNQHTPLGYVYEICLSLFCCNCFIITNAFGLFVVSLCLYLRAFYDIFRDRQQKLDIQNDYNKKKNLCNLIRFHIMAKDLFEVSANAFSPFILVMLVCAALEAANVNFQFEWQLKHGNAFSMAFIMYTAIFQTFNLFVYCYFGKLATESFQNIADSLYDCDWQRYPIELQKIIMMMIGNAQRPVFYHGFGMVVLDLRTFIKFGRGVYTYYMMFKTLSPQ